MRYNGNIMTLCLFIEKSQFPPLLSKQKAMTNETPMKCIATTLDIN
jgi:hypothetical protein